MADPLYLGIDLGSITVKAVLADEAGSILFQRYQRHGAASRETLASILERCEAEHPGTLVHGAVTGSAALDLPERWFGAGFFALPQERSPEASEDCLTRRILGALPGLDETALRRALRA